MLVAETAFASRSGIDCRRRMPGGIAFTVRPDDDKSIVKRLCASVISRVWSPLPERCTRRSVRPWARRVRWICWPRRVERRVAAAGNVDPAGQKEHCRQCGSDRLNANANPAPAIRRNISKCPELHRLTLSARSSTVNRAVGLASRRRLAGAGSTRHFRGGFAGGGAAGRMPDRALAGLRGRCASRGSFRHL